MRIDSAALGRWLPLVGAFVVVAAVVAIVLDDGPQGRLLPPPTGVTSADPVATTAVPDFSQVVLAPVPGETTTTGPIPSGNTTLRGTVEGPEGGVAGGVVRADRLVGASVQRFDVGTDASGGWVLGNLPGGRYRVRAFLPGAFAMDDAEVFYVPDGEVRDLRLVVDDFRGVSVTASTNPGAPIVGRGVNLAVRVVEGTVDGDGVARQVPLVGVAVRISSTGWTTLDVASTTTTTDDDDETDDPGPTASAGGEVVITTDTNGVAVFEFRCDRITDVTAVALVGENQDRFPLSPPSCAPVPTTTTTTTTAPAEDGPDEDGPDEDGPEDSTTTTGG